MTFNSAVNQNGSAVPIFYFFCGLNAGNKAGFFFFAFSSFSINEQEHSGLCVSARCCDAAAQRETKTRNATKTTETKHSLNFQPKQIN